VRRRVAFAEAARRGRVVVEGVVCREMRRLEFEHAGWPAGEVALLVEPVERVLARRRPAVLVDARLAKTKLDLVLPEGIFFVALGPGYEAGRDCDAVVETLRGPDLGRVIWQGSAAPDTGVPAPLGGAAAARVLRAPAAGRLRVLADIGERVRTGQVVARVGRAAVRAALDGVLRGMLAEGDRVRRGQKLGDVDPRPDAPPVDVISDKSRAVGAGVLEAVRERFAL
jgi:xanthine dehydrogenase accessory factor